MRYTGKDAWGGPCHELDGQARRLLLTTDCATLGFVLIADPLDLRHAGAKATDLPFGYGPVPPDQPYFPKPFPCSQPVAE